MAYAIRVTDRAVRVVTGADQSEGIVTAESTGVKVGLRQKWGGGGLRSRNVGDRMVSPGNAWPQARSPSPFGSYSNTPATATFSPPVQSPYLAPPGSATLSPLSPPTIGLGLPHNAFGSGSTPLPPPPPRSPRLGNSNLPGAGQSAMGSSAAGSSYSPYSMAAPLPGTPSYAHFPPTPSHDGGFSKHHVSPLMSLQKGTDSRKDE